MQKLVGQHPKPFNNFREIGCAPAELNINLSSESESGIFRLTVFRHIRFFLISVDRHFAKVSTHILYPKLRHPRLYQAEFFFIYEEFDLYRSLTIPVSGIDAIPLLFSYLSSVVKCFIIFVGFFNSVLKNWGYIGISSSSETHTKCSLLLPSMKLSLTGAKASGTFI